MNTDVEDRLQHRLPELAGRVDGSTVELGDVMSRVDARRRRRSVTRAASALCGLALLVGGVVVVNARRGTIDVGTSGSGSGPTRTEVPLTRLTSASPAIDGVTKGDAVGYRLNDGGQLVFSVRASSFFDAYYQSSCRSMSGETGCLPVAPDIDLGPLPWVDLELAGTNDMVVWIGLPATVATVELRQGDDVRWQTVLDGVAAFPVDHHDPSDEVVAYDAAGTEVMRASWATVTLIGESTRIGPDGGPTAPMYSWSSTFGTESAAWTPEVDATILEGMTQAEEDATRAFADGAMRQCLVDQGDAAWNACLGSTDAALKAYLAER